jgi:hypothetical protein
MLFLGSQYLFQWCFAAIPSGIDLKPDPLAAFQLFE